MSKLSISQLYEDLREELKLSILSGESGVSRWINHTHFQKNGLPLAGFLKAVHPDRVQVWGSTEVGFLEDLKEEERIEAVRKYFRMPLCAVLVTGGNIYFSEYQGCIGSIRGADYTLGLAWQGFDAEIVGVSRGAPLSACQVAWRPC